MSKVDKQVLQMLMDYHIYQGDKSVRHCGIIKTANGHELHLMRFCDKAGNRVSSVDMICYGANGEYATELYSCEREKELQMIADVSEVLR